MTDMDADRVERVAKAIWDAEARELHDDLTFDNALDVVRDMYLAVARAAIAEADKWLPIESAPKDGMRILWGGRWKPFDINAGGGWQTEIFSWTTLMSDGTGYQWLGPNFCSPDHWNVEWTYWQPLPAAPAPPKEAKEGWMNISQIKESIRKPYLSVFLDGRNEHGSHVLTIPGASIDDTGDIIDQLADQDGGLAEEIISDAETLGHQVGHFIVTAWRYQHDEHVYFEYEGVDPVLTELMHGTPTEQSAALRETEPT